LNDEYVSTHTRGVAAGIRCITSEISSAYAGAPAYLPRSLVPSSTIHTSGSIPSPVQRSSTISPGSSPSAILRPGTASKSILPNPAAVSSASTCALHRYEMLSPTSATLGSARGCNVPSVVVVSSVDARWPIAHPPTASDAAAAAADRSRSRRLARHGSGRGPGRGVIGGCF
jgi:hypothetical protein